MNPAEAAAYLFARHAIRRTVGTLAKLRTIGGGPLFRKAGRSVLYDPEHLDVWAAKIKSAPVASTSELRAAG